MNKNISILTLAFVALIGFSGCTEKTINDFDPFMAGLSNGSYLKGLATFNPATNSWTEQFLIGNTLDAANLANARIGIKVRSWGVDPVVTANIFVVRNSNSNQSAWRFIKKYTIAPGDTSYFDILVSAQEIATALGIQMNANAGNFAPGSIFTCYIEAVTQSGKKYTLNNSNFTGSGANFYYSMFSFRGSVVCPYNPAAMPGNYVVVADGWDDWSVGDVIPNPISATTATSLSMLNVYPNPDYPGANSPQPIRVDVVVASGVATVTDQQYGRYGTTAYAVTSQGSSNFVYSCTGTITLLLRHHAPGSVNLSAGTFQLTLRKQ